MNAHVVAERTGTAPSTYRSSFEDVARLGVVPPDLARALAPSVGLRNVLVHEYADVDLRQVAASIRLAQEHYADYVRSVAGWLLDHQDDGDP